MPKLTKREEQQLVRHYLDAAEPRVEDIADEYGVSKQTVYAILRRHGVRPDRHRPVSPDSVIPNELADRMAENALRILLDELLDARRRNEVLEAALRKKGVDPDRL
jgi:transposase-like protein